MNGPAQLFDDLSTNGGSEAASAQLRELTAAELEFAAGCSLPIISEAKIELKDGAIRLL